MPNRKSGLRSTWLLLTITVLLPAGLFLAHQLTPPRGPAPQVHRSGSSFPKAELPLQVQSVDPQPAHSPRVTNVQVIDFDEDGRPDIVCCDAVRNRVIWYQQTTEGQWRERMLADGYDLAAPAHATVVDLDRDGDRDVVVSLLGSVWPTDERVGRVVWLENDGDWRFTPRVILNDVRRVADAQAGDLDADGDLDLVVAVFGYSLGQILWLENVDGNFHEHQLLVTPGTIHVPLADYDSDGDLDVIALVSQEEEEVWAFENLGGDGFAPRRRRVYFTLNHDLGSAGLVRTDLDQDGDMDLLLSAGDNLEILHHYPQPAHGCIWLENRGNWEFVPQRIAHCGGTYGAASGDHDGDGDQDVVLVSMFNDWQMPAAASVVWLENDGRQQFQPRQLADHPTHLATVACGDFNGDGRDDIVTGGLYLTDIADPPSGVTLWLSQ